MSILLVIATMAVRFVAVITFLGAAEKPMFSLMRCLPLFIVLHWQAISVWAL